MPYIKTVICYYPGEREEFHRKGIWIDKEGNQLPLDTMSYRRVESLCRTIVKWAQKEDFPGHYLRKHPIVPHLIRAISRVGLRNSDTDIMFLIWR